jgi:hypothetical protein
VRDATIVFDQNSGFCVVLVQVLVFVSVIGAGFTQPNFPFLQLCMFPKHLLLSLVFSFAFDPALCEKKVK